MTGLASWVTPHFQVAEFDQPQRYGCPPCNYPVQWITQRLLPLCQQLELLRTALGERSIEIVSGYRTALYNRAVGGVEHSQHCEGRAADIAVAGVTARDVQREVSRLLQIGGLPLIRGVGRYPRFTHLDIRIGPLVSWAGKRTRT